MISAYLGNCYKYSPLNSNIENIQQVQYGIKNSNLFQQPTAVTESSIMSSSSEPATSKTETAKINQQDGQVKFSIDNILGLNGRKCPEKNTSSSPIHDSGDETDKETVDDSTFSWLQCTRFKPPKLQRIKKKDGAKKRKLGRNPRVPFSQHQVVVLEEKFRRTHYLSSMDVAELSAALNLSETRVKIWFQNRRARERRDRDAVQHSQVYTNKNIQPLAIPNIAWPMASSSSTSSAFAQFRTALEFSRSSYITSAFSLYPQHSLTDTKNTWTSLSEEKETDDSR